MPLILTEKTGINLAVDGGNLDVSVDGSLYATSAQGALADTAIQPSSGTWTPVITGSVSNPTLTYVVQSGNYVKIGDLVFYRITIGWNTLSGGSGTVDVSLPLASAAAFADYGGSVSVDSVTYPVGMDSLVPFVPSSSTTLYIMSYGSGVSTNTISASNLSVQGALYIRGAYKV